MTFEDQTIEIDSDFGPLKVIVTGEALHILWGEGARPSGRRWSRCCEYGRHPARRNDQVRGRRGRG